MMNKPILLCIATVTIVLSILNSSEGSWSAGDILFKFQGKYKHHEEWIWWKKVHSKSYKSYQEELERHLIWLSNRKFIEQHNANAHIFGYTLEMNYWGDMVSKGALAIIVQLDIYHSW